MRLRGPRLSDASDSGTQPRASRYGGKQMTNRPLQQPSAVHLKLRAGLLGAYLCHVGGVSHRAKIAGTNERRESLRNSVDLAGASERVKLSVGGDHVGDSVPLNVCDLRTLRNSESMLTHLQGEERPAGQPRDRAGTH